MPCSFLVENQAVYRERKARGEHVLRKPEKVESKRSFVRVRPPRPSDARESGNIEQDVDAMVLIHRPGYYDQKTKGTRCEIALNRNGETGILRLEEQLQFCRFAPSTLKWSDTADQDYKSDGFDR